MEQTGHKHVILILMRELAANLAVPMFIVDPEGTLVYYNEPGEEVLGERFAEVGELGPTEWGTRWAPEYLDGRPAPADELPLTIALREQRPRFAQLRIVGLDGERRAISVAAFPLFARREEFVGAVAAFWELENEE